MLDRFTDKQIDAHVGGRIKHRRRQLELSQQQLADCMGLTFQQVQKYENGANRVSASRMLRIAHALRVPVQYFYEGLAEPDPEPLPGKLAASLAVKVERLPRDMAKALSCFVDALVMNTEGQR